MDTKELEQLIERYFDANLSIDEERELGRLLAMTEVPEHMEHDKQVILSLQAGAAEPDYTEAIELLSQRIDAWGAEEHRSIRRSRIVRMWKAASVAACAILILGVGLHLNRPVGPRDTFDNPEEAYAATREALLTFSAALNKGTSYVAMAVETTGQVEQTIAQQFDKLKEYDDNN